MGRLQSHCFCCVLPFRLQFSVSMVRGPLDNKAKLAKLTKKRKASAVTAALAAVTVAGKHALPYYVKTLRNTSRLTGQQWLSELLEGHPEHFYDCMGMHKHVFCALLAELFTIGLHDTRWVSAEEQLAIFMHLAVMGNAQQHLEERFQCSPYTLSKCVAS